MTDDDDENDGKTKGRDKKRPLPDRSTPDPADVGLVEWISNLFRGNERADTLVVTRLWGRGGQERDGTPTMKYHFPADKQPTQEDCVIVTNALVSAMRNDADATGISLLFEVTAHNLKRGPGAFESRRLRFEPTTRLVDGKRKLSGSADGDYDGLPATDEIYRRRHVDGFTAVRDGNEQVLNSLGGLVHVLVRMNENSSKKIDDLLGININQAKTIIDIQSKVVDDKIRWSNHEFGMRLRERGLNLVAGLLPGVVEKMTNHKMPGGRSAASLQIESVIESLSTEERTTIIGNWENGQQISSGILTEAQVRVLGGVQNGESEEILDRLIDGPDAVTGEQIKAIMSTCGEKILPLLGLVQERREKFAKAQTETHKGDK